MNYCSCVRGANEKKKDRLIYREKEWERERVREGRKERKVEKIDKHEYVVRTNFGWGKTNFAKRKLNMAKFDIWQISRCCCSCSCRLFRFYIHFSMRIIETFLVANMQISISICNQTKTQLGYLDIFSAGQLRWIALFGSSKWRYFELLSSDIMPTEPKSLSISFGSGLISFHFISFHFNSFGFV